MSKIFESTQNADPSSSGFDLSHSKTLSMDMGYLVPHLVHEVLPKDNTYGRSEHLVRLAPLVAPVMHRIDVWQHFFFVPNRLLWNQWEDFITGGRQGTTAPVMPTVTLATAEHANGTLADYLGITTASGSLSVSSLAFRAYLQIWNDYFRDPNLEDPKDITDDSLIKPLRQRAWEKDYFTSCLPWEQRGVEVDVNMTPDSSTPAVLRKVSGGAFPADGTIGSESSIDGELQMKSGTDSGANVYLDPNLSVTLNQLRESAALQRFLEANARGGPRYIEQIAMHFGVKSSDARLQRAEFLGSSKTPLTISEVLNTSATATDPQGNMAGHGVSVGEEGTFKHFAEEHGFIMGITSILPKTSYNQGVPRHFDRSSRTDYYWPEFANLGEQEVLNKELYWIDGNPTHNQGIFGYQQRWAEYKYVQDSVHGDFRNSNLDHWHMARQFSSAPSLNTDFVRADPTNRIFADTSSEHKVWCQVYNSLKASRAMPYFSIPSLFPHGRTR
jgi:hypothetical protein